MNIAKFCIRHKVTTLLAVIMIAVFGVVYTTQLQMALLPNIEYPAAYVYCYYNGAGPEDIEQLVTRPLESAIMSVPGVDSVTSSSADSISTIQIMYVENTDVDIAATKLAREVRRAQPARRLRLSRHSEHQRVRVDAERHRRPPRRRPRRPPAAGGERGRPRARAHRRRGVRLRLRRCGASDHRDARRAARRGLRPLHQLHHADPPGGEPALSRR